MLDNGRSAGQISAIADCTFAEAQTASYMASAAKSGWSLADFCEKTGVAMAQARSFAFRFGIEFSDYSPDGQAKLIQWRKAKTGWELVSGADVIGNCLRQADGRYLSQACGFSEQFWDARTSMRRLSEILDGSSPELFGGKPLKAQLLDAEGNVEDILFGLVDDETRRCRSALSFDLAA